MENKMDIEREIERINQDIDDMQEALNRQKVEIPYTQTKQIIHYNADNYAQKLAECIELRKQGIAAELIPERRSTI